MGLTQTLMDGYMITRGFRSALDSPLRFPVPNHGLDAVGRSIHQSAQTLQYWSQCLEKAPFVKYAQLGVYPERSLAWAEHAFGILCCSVCSATCCLQEIAVKENVSGRFLWNVNSSSTHSSSRLLSFPLQWKHTPHTFHPASHPQRSASHTVPSLILVLTCRC